jgi:hypothetical protein
MYLYDAQTGHIHQVETTQRNELAEFGYKDNQLKWLSKICFSMEGLDRWSEEEAVKATELRLFYGNKLLVANGTVHDIRTQLGGVMLTPHEPTRRVLFAKVRERINQSGHLHDYRYVVSNISFDEPEFGSLDNL